jgi:peroxiredoxin 2/4
VDTRATFVIDPQGMIRAITWYAMTVGRCVDELAWLLAALQTSDLATF